MKKIIVLLCLAVSTSFLAQRSFQGKATYMSKRSMDMSRFGEMSEQQKKQVMARMKSFLEKTYTLSFNQTESLFKEEVALEAPGTSGPSWGRSNGQGAIYKNAKEKEMIEDVEMFSKRFLVIEDMEQPKWEMSTETKKIGDYTCYKATLIKEDTTVDWSDMFGRRGRDNQEKDSTANKNKQEEKRLLEVTAWYTPQIPINSGPESYWGLPGLILEVNAGRTTMLCTEIIINPEETITIEKPTKGKKVDREEYNKIVKEKAEEIREQFRNRGSRGGRSGRF